MFENPLFVVGVLCFGYVYFFLSDQLWDRLEQLGKLLPESSKNAMMTRSSIKVFGFFTVNLNIVPKTKEEKELVKEITKTLVLGRCLIALGGVCFLLFYLLHSAS